MCDVPVPAGYPQSQTHSSIYYYEGRYYLTTSPYPGKKYSVFQMRIRGIMKRLSCGRLCRSKSGEVYENPCFYEGIGTNDKAPVTFRLFSERPLMDTPEPIFGLPAFNSDPELFIENGRAYILNRAVYRTKLFNSGYECLTDIFLIEGNLGYERFKLDTIKLIKEWEKPYASPCLIKFKTKYLFSYLDTNSALDATTFNGLYLQELDAIGELAYNQTYRRIKVNSGNLLPWHMSLFSYRDKLYTIIACVRKGDKTRKIWQMFGEFNDELTELSIYPKPLTDFNSYRGAALVRDDGRFILYSTVLWEQIKGTKSIDGRDVVLAECDFSKLQTALKY